MDEQKPRALVVGARPGSLGEAVAREYILRSHSTSLAGISGEAYYLDVQNQEATDLFFENNHMFDHVICTVGVNREVHPDQEFWVENVQADIEDNLIGPLRLFDAWAANIYLSPRVPTFVFVSSNSAHVARSRSVGYCSSKAALSMASRCLGRYFAKQGVSIWAVEPGWIDGTPMSDEVSERLLGPDTTPHRIHSGRGVSRLEVASFIYHTAMNNPSANGCTFRLDGGEQ